MTSLLDGMVALTQAATGVERPVVDRGSEPFASAGRLAAADAGTRSRVREYIAEAMLGGVADEATLDAMLAPSALREHPVLGCRGEGDDLRLTVAYRRGPGRGTLRAFPVGSPPGAVSPHCGLITPAMLGLEEVPRSAVLVVPTLADALTAAVVLRTPAVFAGGDGGLGAAVASLVASVAADDRARFGEHLAPVRRVVVMASRWARLGGGQLLHAAMAESGVTSYGVVMPDTARTLADLVRVTSASEVLGEVAHADRVDPRGPEPVVAYRFPGGVVLRDERPVPFFDEAECPDPRDDDPLRRWRFRFGDGTEADLRRFGVPAVVLAGPGGEYALSGLGTAPLVVRDATASRPWVEVVASLSANGSRLWLVALDDDGEVVNAWTDPGSLLNPEPPAVEGFDEAVIRMMGLPVEHFAAGVRVRRGLGVLRDL